MKAQFVFYDDRDNPYREAAVFDRFSAAAVSAAWAADFSGELGPEVGGVAVEFASPLVVEGPLNAGAFASRLAAHCAAFAVDTVLFAMAAAPFCNSGLTKRVLDTHLRYKAEYTFAEGFCGGLAPAAIDGGALKILARLAEENAALASLPVRASVFFDLIQKDINSFEVETVIAEKDYRAWRLDFTAVTKRSLLSCANLYGALGGAKTRIPALDAAVLCDTAVGTPAVVRTVPSFYNVQISAASPTRAIYTPYSGSSGFMEEALFSSVVKQAAELSGEAVISLSCWGEPLSHPHFADFVQRVLSYPGLSVLVETWGALVSEEMASRVAAVIHSGPKRSAAAINWIVYLDAMDEETYETVHGKNTSCTLEKARSGLDILERVFPGAVYPQFTRMNENEHQLEAFYRHYKERGKVIIQKYDHFCGFLPQRKSADLSPLDRLFCWHHLRDMVILLDGSVPLCKQCALQSGGRGALADIWQSRSSLPFIDMLPQCKDCDEYYTFNF